MMKSNVPLNLIRQFEKKEESEGSEHEEVKKSEIDLMKTSVADLNKSLSTFRRSFIHFTSNKKLPRSISPSRRDPSADNKKIGRASAMKDRTPPSRDLKVGQNAFSNPDLERGSRGTIQRARAGKITPPPLSRVHRKLDKEIRLNERTGSKKTSSITPEYMNSDHEDISKQRREFQSSK
mmetsp:Transcript_35277/g.34936  ORF Transcript_35277/g.34936 Transcript_35277/m.34936 type:complete len:179 (-) Transcript_35277:1687-2223(-)